MPFCWFLYFSIGTTCFQYHYGFHKISHNLKFAAIRMHNQGILPVHTIIKCLRISRRTFYYILELWITTGDVICTLTIDGMISNTVVEGSMTRDRFLHYLEFTVVCAGGCHSSWLYYKLEVLSRIVLSNVSQD